MFSCFFLVNFYVFFFGVFCWLVFSGFLGLCFSLVVFLAVPIAPIT